MKPPMKRLRLTGLFIACLTYSGSAIALTEPASTPAPQAPAPYVKNPLFWPTPVMDHQPPALPKMVKGHAVLVFSKTNGFRDSDQIKAANIALDALVAQKGRDVFVTENAAVFNPEQLAKFEVIILNSISGNVFLPEQREAFKVWLENGGGVVALHGSGGDQNYDWRWYVEDLLGAQFIGHTNRPEQFQEATVKIVDPKHPALAGLPEDWQRTDEWYAFDRVPSGKNTQILAVLDEKTYHPEPKQVMGYHPIIWTRCIQKGRVFFSAMGHKSETYSEPLHLKMISGALDWASLARTKGCD
jgi:type 1 glutamine amidotransferase